MDITITDYYKKEYPKFNKTTITAHTEETASKVFVGIDPGGRHQGVSVYVGKNIFVSQINFTTVEKNPVKKMLDVAESLMYCGIPQHLSKPGYVIIEGASYNEKFGQVSLSEVRATNMLILAQLGFEVVKVPPKRIRLLSLNNGNENGEKYFDFPHDALASFLCCLAAIKLSNMTVQIESTPCP